ncbi:MAG TPA: hypothetical protein VHM25_08640, partial [Polyangiaceae bacterium]|nr:hypothetical protein [Polyangiaceae bacterium]
SVKAESGKAAAPSARAAAGRPTTKRATSGKGVSKAVPTQSPAAKAAPAKPASAKGASAKSTAAKTAPARDDATQATTSKSSATKPTAAKPAAAKPAAAKAESNKRAPVLDSPAKIRPIEQAVGVSSDAVARRTGKSWAQWFALLDAAGAAELDHKGIVAVLAQRHGVGPWWQQMVTVAYEQARGKNGNAASDDGFQVDVSRVLELPLAKLFRFWAEPAERNKWLADDRFSIHKATASKSIRARWGRGVSRIDVDFCEKGPSKSQVTVQHNRIETSDAAEQMKAYWAKKIRALEALTRP